MRAVVLVDTTGMHHALWSGIDPSSYGEVAEFIVRFPQTTYDVAAVRLVIDTDHAPGEWEGIDAVRLLTGGSFTSVSLGGQSADGQGGVWQEHVYNAQGRTTQTQTRNQAGLWQTVTYAYDSSASFLNETITTDVLGQQTRTTYDAQGRVLSSTAGYGSARASTTGYTEYTYGVQGRLQIYSR